MDVSLEVIQPVGVLSETKTTKYVVEVIREEPLLQEVTKYANTVEVVKTAGTLVNIGMGPELPNNPYEGQIWIKT